MNFLEDVLNRKDLNKTFKIYRNAIYNFFRENNIKEKEISSINILTNKNSCVYFLLKVISIFELFKIDYIFFGEINTNYRKFTEFLLLKKIVNKGDYFELECEYYIKYFFSESFFIEDKNIDNILNKLKEDNNIEKKVEILINFYEYLEIIEKDKKVEEIKENLANIVDDYISEFFVYYKKRINNEKIEIEDIIEELNKIYSVFKFAKYEKGLEIIEYLNTLLNKSKEKKKEEILKMFEEIIKKGSIDKDINKIKDGIKFLKKYFKDDINERKIKIIENIIQKKEQKGKGKNLRLIQSKFNEIIEEIKENKTATSKQRKQLEIMLDSVKDVNNEVYFDMQYEYNRVKKYFDIKLGKYIKLRLKFNSLMKDTEILSLIKKEFIRNGFKEKEISSITNGIL